MDLSGSFIIACSMYSRVPMPSVEWTEKRMKYALCFFPVIGIVIGSVIMGIYWFALRMELGSLAVGCVGTVIPLWITGGIHMDGYLDVVDARSSRQSKERKLEIMKDPHIGAFAMIYGGIYLILYLAVFSELPRVAIPAVTGIYVLVRALSGWSVVSFSKARKDGLVTTFAAQAQTRVVQVVMAVWIVAAIGFMMVTGGIIFGFCIGVGAFLVMVWYHACAMREFGGITGDLAGYFLQICELCLLALTVIYFK